jgi:hypothetical protein
MSDSALVTLEDGEVEYWERVAGEGDVVAMRHVASLLQKVDPWRALMWLRKAAEAGDTSAMWGLGYQLAGSNPTEAARWYRLAAEAGEAGPMYNLGLLLKKRDRQESRRWLEQAALHDHVNAMNALARALRLRHPRESLRWARLAAEKGNVNAMTRLALRAYFRHLTALGRNRKRLVDEEVAWWHKAADLNDTGAMLHLGLHYTGQGEHDEARHWLQAATDKGHDAARLVLERGINGRSFLPFARSLWRSLRENLRPSGTDISPGEGSG